MDFAGTLYGKTYFVIVNVHSKWPEVYELISTTTLKTIDIIRQVFAAYSLSNQLASDIGPQMQQRDLYKP